MVLRFAGVELDREARELRRDGTAVPVEPQVFDVLAYLAEHRDRLVTKEELLDEVWGNRFVSDSAVTSRIKSARSAVGDSGREQRVIRTIHRRGFRLVAEVVTGDARPRGGVAAPGESPVDELVGREDELAAVLAALRPGRAVFVVGEPGVGKSRLVREVVRRVPGPVLAAHATPATRNVPFGALAPLLPPEVARIGNGDRLAILGALDAELAQRAGSVLLVDDAHTLDEMSAAVVQQAVADGRLAVLATARTGSPLPESLDRLRPSGKAEWHELGPLDEPSIRRVVHGQLPGGVEPATHVELWRVSRGNPLLAREVVTSGLERGTLQAVDGRWRAVGPLVAGDRLVDVIRSRYVGMTDRLRRGLEVVVVAGDVPLELAEELLGIDGLDGLESSGVLRVDVDGRRHAVRSAHPLHAEAVEATLGLLARRRAARQLAEHLQGTGARRREDAVRLALWRLQSGQQADTELLARAAELALAFYDYRGAETLADAAWQATGDARHAVILAEARFQQGFTHDVEDVLGGADLTGADDRVRTALTVRRASNLVWGLAQPDRALDVNAATTALVQPGPWHEELVAHRATLLVAAGRPGEALSLAQPLREHAATRVRIEATYAAGRALLHLGRPDEARRTARAGYADHLAVEGEIGTGHPAIHLITYAQALLAGGRLTEAERVADSLLVGSREARSNVGETWAGLVLGDVAMLAGRLDEAVTRFDTVANLARRCGQRAHLVVALSSSAIALALLQEEAGAQRALGELAGERVVAEHELAVERARAWVEAAAGDLAAAHDRLLVAAGRAATTGQGWAEATLRHDLVRLGAPAHAATRLAALAVDGGRLVQVQAAHAAAVEGGAAGALAAVAAAFEELGASLLAEECRKARALAEGR